MATPATDSLGNGTRTGSSLLAFRMDCERVLSGLATVADPALSERIAGARTRLATERLKILVVGEFSRGKSTFINALVGQPVLPSKVEPTTAAITVLRGGRPAEAVVEYLDGTQKRLELPSTGINRYLDSEVTTINADANRIRVVRIQFPGRLETIEADVVDTPGVNDLDQAREEVTFKYLREADAAVLLLDGQQPLSESERIFLREKVLGSDVNRILFVINKIDEILVSGSTEDIPRIVQYVKTRLVEQVEGIANPSVFAVSAKNALRARFKGEPDPTPNSFSDFESYLVAFASQQATRGRLQAHVERVGTLVEAQRQLLEEQARALSLELTQVAQYLDDIERNQQLLEQRIAQLEPRLARVRKELATRIRDHATGEVARLRTELTRAVEGCTTEEAVEEFRIQLANHLRNLVTTVETFATRERQKAVSEIEADFDGLLADSSQRTRPVQHSMQVAVPQISSAAALATPQSSPDDTLKTAAAGFGLGFVGGWLFGPIGVGAAVVGSYLLGKQQREARAAERSREELRAMVQSLQDTCDSMVERARQLGDEIASGETDGIAGVIRDRAAIRMEALRQAAATSAQVKSQSREEREALLSEVRAQLARIEQIRQESDQLRRQYCE